MGGTGRRHIIIRLVFVQWCGEDVRLRRGDGGGGGDKEEVADGAGGRSAKMEERGMEDEGVPRFADAAESN